MPNSNVTELHVCIESWPFLSIFITLCRRLSTIEKLCRFDRKWDMGWRASWVPGQTQTGGISVVWSESQITIPLLINFLCTSLSSVPKNIIINLREATKGVPSFRLSSREKGLNLIYFFWQAEFCIESYLQKGIAVLISSAPWLINCGEWWSTCDVNISR